MQPWKDSDHNIQVLVSRPRSRSRSRLRKIIQQPSLKSARKTVTFELVASKRQSSVSVVGLSSHDSNDTADDDDSTDHLVSVERHRSHSPGHFIHGSHLFHWNESPAELANRLSSAIHRALQDHSHEKNSQRFIPDGLLDQILDKKTIQRALESLLPHIQEDYPSRLLSVSQRPGNDSTPATSGIADRIWNQHQKVFATLLLVKHPDAIVDFIQPHGFTDADLPLHKICFTADDGGGPVDVLCAKDRLAHSLLRPCSRCLTHWPLSLIDLFEQKQWETLAPVFDVEKRDSYSLDDRIILPFVYCKPICRGSRGEILKVGIHPNHHNFHNIDASSSSESIFPGVMHKAPPFFAVKKMAKREELQREVRVLKRVDHQHIIRLLATYEHCGSYHLVMPWAECNLAVFWEEKMPNPVRDSKTLHWVARQCLGIANGLSKVQHHLTNSVSSLHGRSFPIPSAAFSASNNVHFRTRRHAFFGRHGDIKPQNLLWFPCKPHESSDLGIIKISDFGEGEFNKSQSAHRSTNSISYTPSYRPPECDDPAGEVEIHTSTFDTWSLGCLYLEFITWYIGGWTFVLEFEQSRYAGPGVSLPSKYRRPSPFFETTGLPPPNTHAMVKPAVIEHFRHLRETATARGNKDQGAFLSAFLKLIQTHMLVIDPHYRDNCTEYRFSCQPIYRGLGEIGKIIGLKDDMFDNDHDGYDEDDAWRHPVRRLMRHISAGSSSGLEVRN